MQRRRWKRWWRWRWCLHRIMHTGQMLYILILFIQYHEVDWHNHPRVVANQCHLQTAVAATALEGRLPLRLNLQAIQGKHTCKSQMHDARNMEFVSVTDKRTGACIRVRVRPRRRVLVREAARAPEALCHSMRGVVGERGLASRAPSAVCGVWDPSP